MKSIVGVCLLISTLLLVGCHRRLESPELKDPVFLDMKKDADLTLNKIAQTEKDLAKAKDDYAKAPIRTGLREDAHDNYFEIDHKLEALREKYRYSVLKAQLRRKYDQKAYDLAFKNHKAWPDMESFFEYQTEKRLQNAPREWNPDARIKAREPAATAPAAEKTSKEE